ncbi:ATP-dependent DNA helicase RecG [Paeniglutamicibacter gangotriensis]|uniref:Probable DNA 3'-5' helicase RecG n=1 Tax=Paeniglutamicibacter gangotriensis Lz1y TaxID=1276920 RepID=M7MY22_9MICC|nr:ATP-dependent DNA helicase RecG [Paeniglutamicibacter gangotriensis]EMQ99961.1 ATP-dependent DNA helicase RecG [Paeniglutamicibacter gangotriensis Lz1y]
MTDDQKITSDTPLETIIGAATARKVETAFGYVTVGEMLSHFPRRYMEIGELSKITELPVGEDVTIVAEVRTVNQRRMHSRSGFLLEVVVSDALGPEQSQLRMTFFNGYEAKRDLQVGSTAMFSGKVGMYRDHLELTHPEYSVLDTAQDADPRPIPIYPATAKFPNKKIRDVIELLLAKVGSKVFKEFIPGQILDSQRIPPRDLALENIHRPQTVAQGYAARKRFAFEEAFLLQLALAQRRVHRMQQPAVVRHGTPAGLLCAFDASLPFTLTEGQVVAGEEIAGDLARGHPMNRLLQGEVGSGKTLVALRAMLQVIDSGGQTALLAPTEVLAQQHHQSIKRMLGSLGNGGELGSDPRATRVDVLTGSASAGARKRALLGAASGETGILIGTHALLSDMVNFVDLGLVVVDEQHRFGVEQRDALRSKAETPPHMLVMTATPIPRTVAMTVFGDLEVSLMKSLPAGRAPIVTHLVPLQVPQMQERLFARIAEEAAKGHQVYVVCPRISEKSVEDDFMPMPAEPGASGTGGEANTKPPSMTVENMMEILEAMPAFANTEIRALHGRMASDEKAAAMDAFDKGKASILVSTTVIEVGVDVHNATLMVIIDAENFGISQLHQLRGRIGRGGLPGTCLMTTWLDAEHPSVLRLRAVESTTDGFLLAESDLNERREGDILGASQSGSRSTLKVLRVMKDAKLIAQARNAAESVVANGEGLGALPALQAAVEDWVDEDMQAFLERG